MPLGQVIGGIQTVAGLAQGIIGSVRAKKAERELENLQTPTTTQDSAINQFYQSANANPYDSAMYKVQQQNAGRNLATGLASLQSRRSGLAGISGLVRGHNDNLLRAGIAAEQQQKQLLGQATRMKASDNQRVWEVNQLMPYQKKFSLLGAKAAGANQMANTGFSNAFGGLQTAGIGLNKQ